MTMYLHLTGSTYCAGQQTLRAAQAGEYEIAPNNLFLVRESENQYDPNAVQVWWCNGKNEVKLGYVAKEQAPTVARYIDRGRGVHITGKSIYGSPESFCGLYMTAEISDADPVKGQHVK